MFAPIIKGAACFRVTIFLATIGTTTEVVIVLDRIAAVVSNPHEKDFKGFLKKKRLNTSGDLAFNRLESNRRKMRIDVKRSTKANIARINALGIASIRASMIGPNPNQKCRT